MAGNQNQPPVTGGGGFLRVLYGNGTVLLCNTDCSCLHLFSYIRDTCAPGANLLSLELCTEKGRLSGGTEIVSAIYLKSLPLQTSPT
jgi:hypothetical protein